MGYEENQKIIIEEINNYLNTLTRKVTIHNISLKLKVKTDKILKLYKEDKLDKTNIKLGRHYIDKQEQMDKLVEIINNEPNKYTREDLVNKTKATTSYVNLLLQEVKEQMSEQDYKTLLNKIRKSEKNKGLGTYSSEPKNEELLTEQEQVALIEKELVPGKKESYEGLAEKVGLQTSTVRHLHKLGNFKGRYIKSEYILELESKLEETVKTHPGVFTMVELSNSLDINYNKVTEYFKDNPDMVSYYRTGKDSKTNKEYTDKQVVDYVNANKGVYTIKDLTKKFKKSKYVISKIVRNNKLDIKKGISSHNAKSFNIDKVNKVILECKTKPTVKYLALKTDLSEVSIRNYIKDGYVDKTKVLYDIEKRKLSREEVVSYRKEARDILEIEPNVYTRRELMSILGLNRGKMQTIITKDMIDKLKDNRENLDRQNYTDTIDNKKKQIAKEVTKLATSQPITKRQAAIEVGIGHTTLAKYIREGYISNEIFITKTEAKKLGLSME